MSNRHTYLQLLVLSVVLILVLGPAAESRALDGCCDWIWPWNWGSSRTTYAPPYPGPAVAPPSTGCTTCGPTPTVAAYLAPATFRTYVQRPVTVFMPVAAPACATCPAATLAPAPGLVREARLLPYTSAYMGFPGGTCSNCVGVGSCVGGSCATLGYANYSGPACSSCGTCSSCASCPSCDACSSCGSCCGAPACSSCGGCSSCGSCGGCSSCGASGSCGSADGCSSCGVPATSVPTTVNPAPATTAPTLPSNVTPDGVYAPQAGATPAAPNTNPPSTFAPPPTAAPAPTTPPSGTAPPATFRNQSLPGPSTQMRPIPDLGPAYQPLPLPRQVIIPENRTTWQPVQPSGPVQASGAVQFVAAAPRAYSVATPASATVPAVHTVSQPAFSGWRAGE